MEQRQDAGERLARIETHIHHIKEEQGSMKSEQAAHEQDMRDFKESIFQLRASAEAQVKSIAASLQRMDRFDQAVEQMNKRITTLREDFTALKGKVTMIISGSCLAVTVLWAVFGNMIQDLVSSFLGR